MFITQMLFAMLQWILFIILGLIFLVEVVVRAVRRYKHFPIPAFIARFIDNPIRRRIQPPSKVVSWINIKSGMRVLEVGSGPGTFTIEAARRAGISGMVLAIDIQPSITMKLKSKLRKMGVVNMEPIVASVHELPFPNKIFDRTFMITVLGELPDKEKALLEIKCTLKENGLLAIGELLLDPDYPRRKTVIKLCRKTGFKLVEKHGGILHYLLVFTRLAK